MNTDPKRVLVLGGGFAGVYTARYLEKLLCAEQVSITLINRENYWVYQRCFRKSFRDQSVQPM